MARGKLITQDEIERVHSLKKNDGLGPTAIAKEIHRSVSAVHKMLSLNPQEQTIVEPQP